MWVIQHPETVTPLWTTGRCLSENLDGMDISGCVRVLVSGFVGWLVVLDGMDISGCVRFSLWVCRLVGSAGWQGYKWLRPRFSLLVSRLVGSAG